MTTSDRIDRLTTALRLTTTVFAILLVVIRAFTEKSYIDYENMNTLSVLPASRQNENGYKEKIRKGTR